MSYSIEAFSFSPNPLSLGRDEIDDGANDQLPPGVGEQVQARIGDLLLQDLVELAPHLVQELGDLVGGASELDPTERKMKMKDRSSPNIREMKQFIEESTVMFLT